ncbi:MAG: universal stress protein [Bacteroidetes bacterium]|nr:universal stress protein [Bacteroidota bacterium]
MKTINIKKVLIAVDYDPTAQKVAEVGFSLAKAMGAEVILLHVLIDPVFYSSSEYSPIMGFTGSMDTVPLQLGNIEEMKRISGQFLEKAKYHLGDETIQTVIKEGDFAESILATAKEVHADVIVMGSHSRRWLDEILMGSVTKNVLHLSTIPLFIIPTRKRN